MAVQEAESVLDGQAERIAGAWVDRLEAELYPQRPDLKLKDLRSRAPEIIHGLAEALRRGEAANLEAPWTEAARTHAELRLAQQVPLGDLLREYQMLRQELWRALQEQPAATPGEVYGLAARLDSALDMMATIGSSTYGAELRRAAELDAVFENTDAQLALLDCDFHFVMVNAAYARDCGHARDELIGRNHFALFPNRENQAIFERVRALGEPYQAIEKPFEYADQPWRGVTYWNWTLAPIKGAGGRVEGLLLSLTDVTPQVRARQQAAALTQEMERRAAELDTIVSSIADGLVLYDRNGDITRMNATAEGYLGYTPAERGRPLAARAAALGTRIAEGRALPPEDALAVRALRGESVHSMVVALRQHGRVLWLSASAAPLAGPDGAIQGAVMTLSDITAQRDLQEQLEDVLRSVSHDLRNPLAAVQGQAQLLLRRLRRTGAGGPERANAEAIVGAARRMDTMIQDLVDAARMEAGPLKLDLQPVDLVAFAIELQQQLAGTMEVGRIRIEGTEGLPAVSADRAHLERVLINLLSNGLKYSAPGSVVTVAFKLEGSEVVTTVADRGPGIRPEALSRLFQRYGRVEAAGSKPEGLGLGLYIARKLVEAMGGHIWAESEVGEGSTFSFALPSARNA